MGDKKLLFENDGGYVCLNGDIMETSRYIGESVDDGWWDARVAYEVVHAVHGVPLFFEDHAARLRASLAKLGEFPESVINSSVTETRLLAHAKTLMLANNLKDCNIKIWAAVASAQDHIQSSDAETDADLHTPTADVDDDPEARPVNVFININRRYLPLPEYYKDGAPAGLLEYTRTDPNVKRFVAGYKERIREMTDGGGVYEVLLFDEAGRLTEGSRSNLFFTGGGIIYTAPENLILKGIRRKYALEAARRAGFEVRETPVTLSDAGLLSIYDEPGLSNFEERQTPADECRPSADHNQLVDGAFITGTAVGVLPISKIGDTVFNSAKNPVIRKIMEEYNKLAQDYIHVHIDE